MNTLLEQDENFKTILKSNPNIKTYKQLTQAGELIKQYDKINGSWADTTELVKAKAELEKLQKLEKKHGSKN